MMDVAIFWDYENCPAPSSASGCNVVNSIRLMAKPYGRIKSFKAYLAITDQYNVARAVTLRSELQASGVSLIDCPHNGRKEVADKMIIVDMLTYAIDNPAPATIILITGDRDFAYSMSILRLRQYEVILVTLSNAHSTLTSQASLCMDWVNDVLKANVRLPVKSSHNFICGHYSGRDHSPVQKRSLSSQSIQIEEEEDSGDRTNQVPLLQHYLRGASSSTRCRHSSVSSHRPDCQYQWESWSSHSISPIPGVETSTNEVDRNDQFAMHNSVDTNSIEASRTTSSEMLPNLQGSVEIDITAEDHNSLSERSHIAPVSSNFQTNKPLPTFCESVKDHETDTTEDVSDAESYFSCLTRPASRVHTLLASPVLPVHDLEDAEPPESEAPSTLVGYPIEAALVESNTCSTEDSSSTHSNTHDSCKTVSFAVSSPNPESPASISSTPTVGFSVPRSVTTDVADCSSSLPPFTNAASATSVITPSTPPVASTTTLHAVNTTSNITSSAASNGNIFPDTAADCSCCIPPVGLMYNIPDRQPSIPPVASPAALNIASSAASTDNGFRDTAADCGCYLPPVVPVYTIPDTRRPLIPPVKSVAALYPTGSTSASPSVRSTQSSDAVSSSSTITPWTIHMTQSKQTGSTINSQAGSSRKTPVIKLSGENAKFQTLVDVLHEERESFPDGIERTHLGAALVNKDPNVYLRANVKKFRAYIQAAIDAGIVGERNQDDPNNAKIFLLRQNTHPHQSAKLVKPTSKATTTPAQTKPKLTGTNARFRILVDVLRQIRDDYPNGVVPRTDLAPALIAKNPQAYSKFKTYISEAIEAGIVCEKKKQSIALTDRYA